MKFDLRLARVRYGAEHGLKPAARRFGCTRRIVRKWWRRGLAENHARQSLADRSRAPHSCPHKTPAGVESLHERVEAEFFDRERFAHRRDFFDKASAWQLWFHTVRTNAYKGRRAPDQILREENPARNPHLWFLPALDLDQLLARRACKKTLNKSPAGDTMYLLCPSLHFGFSLAHWAGGGRGGRAGSPGAVRGG